LQWGDLQIKPIRQLGYYCPVLYHESFYRSSADECQRIVGCKIIIGVNEKEITHRFKAPLQAGIDVEIVCLVIVLQKGIEENTLAEREFSPGPD
jgi:hypothetical protein